MVFSVIQLVVTVALTIIGVSAFGLSGGEIPALALAIPALWLLPQGGVAAWLLLIALGMYGLVLPYQPLSLSVSVWTLIPIFSVTFSHKSSKQMMLLIGAVVLAMQAGVMALQAEGKLPGSAWYTFVQMLAVGMVWIAARSWRPVKGNTWWPLFLVVPLWVGGMEHAALVALCVTGLMAALQSIAKSKHASWLPALAWALPTVGFATFVVLPQFEVPSSILVSWMLILGTGWMADFMLNEENEEEI